jgi:predicted metal-dependent phosphoesterase TrpH
VRRIDLHAHTVHSDGTLTPTELVERAHAHGLVGLAVTDHDTTSALAEARAAGERLGLEIFDGCEITAGLPSGTVHILAYAFDDKEPVLEDLLKRVREGRHARNLEILRKLEALRVPLSYEEVSAFAHGTIVARPHFAQALIARNHVGDAREAFQLYLRDGGPAYARADVPTAEEAIRAVTAAGGVTVLAHPRTLKMENRRGYEHVIKRLKKAGLSGLEVDHPSHDPTKRRLFGEIARIFDLVPTGGSDFHGANKPRIEIGVGNGTIEVPYETWERLLERCPSRGAA